MTQPTKTINEFLTFANTLRDELMSMPDEDVLEGTDLKQLRARRARMLETARTEAGRRRMAAAKAQTLSGNGVAAKAEQIDPSEARRYLAQAANDRRFTLVARELGEDLSDEDAIRLYRQLRSLEHGPSEDKS